MSRSLHPDQLLAQGAMEGPYRRTRPWTSTRRMRFVRWLKKTLRIE